MRFPALILTTLPLIVPAQSASDCSCGYTINATDTNDVHFFTEILETDFLHYNQSWDPVTGLPRSSGPTSENWIVQAYSVSSDGESNPWGKKAEYGNVIANPIGNAYDWGGEGVGDKGVELWVRRAEEEDRMVPMAEMVSARDDVLYGSFRVGMKMSNVRGTVGAFFFYLNDSSEIDIEILSKQNPNKTLNLIVQSPQSASRGYASGPDFVQHNLVFAPASGYNEYRFDWLPNRVDFYANSELLATITENVPSSAGSLHLSHWSNGNFGWSAGPPEQDAKMVVSYVKAYFNSTTSEDVLACRDAVSKICVVPDQKDAPEVDVVNGNQTGRTTFLQGMNETSLTEGHGSEPKTSGATKLLTNTVFLMLISLILYT